MRESRKADQVGNRQPEHRFVPRIDFASRGIASVAWGKAPALCRANAPTLCHFQPIGYNELAHPNWLAEKHQ
jgi:hypothetical protein